MNEIGLIGKKIVDELIKLEYNVVIGDLGNKSNIDFVSSLSGKNHIFCEVDIIRKKDIDKAITKSLKKFGSVDACINLSYPRSLSWGTRFEEISISELSENFKLLLGTNILLSQRILKYFIKQGYGNLILFSSIQGIAAPKFEHYQGTE